MAVLESLFPRRRTRQILLGGVAIGGGAPISVQSMTKTDTRNVKATIRQIHALNQAGCEIVRLAVPNAEAAEALARIRKAVRMPLVADVHFDHRLALRALKAGVDGLRLNPGTIGAPDKVREIVKAAKERRAVIRIGINSGSLEKDLLKKYGGATAEAMAASALRQVRFLEDLGFREIKVSLKASDVPRTLEAYRLMARRTDAPFHAGITEAGGLLAGAVKSAAGLALLLREGLADTVRVSLTAAPEEEALAAFRILAALRLRQRGPEIVSCPTCGRCEVNLIPLAAKVENRLAGLSCPLVVAVMGCAVNGPGEAREADIGVAFGRNKAVIFKEGKLLRQVRPAEVLENLVREALALARQKQGSGE
jgi:(E)-4-hydroxy-3-methylbut-2-enyl-diphosphate synthase